MKFITNYLLGFFLLFATPTIGGELPATEFERYFQQYPGEDQIVIRSSKTMKIWVEDDEIKASYHTQEESIYLMDNARLYGDRQVYHSNNMELKKLEAYTLAPNGKKYKKANATDHKLVDFTDSGIFSDDSRETHFTLPLMDKGVKTNLNVDYQLNDPRMIPMLLLSPYQRIENAEFRLEIGPGVNVEITPFNLEEGAFTFREEKGKKGKSIKIWSFAHPAKVKAENNAPAVRYFAQQLAVRIKNYSTSSGTVAVLEDLNGLHQWYCSFVQKTVEDVQQLKPLSDSIVAGLSTPMLQAQKLYQWVQGNVRYIAFEEGEKGLMPARATEVCSNRFGDCKGMSNLLYNLLRAQGIDANLAWVGTRDLPFTYEELPTPNVDNHMICVAKIDGKYVILDATNSKVKFGLPSPFIQGKQILVNKECQSFEIITAPETPADSNLVEQQVTISLQGDTVLGRGTITFHGYSSMSIKESYSVGPNHKLKDEFKGLLSMASNKFLLDQINVENFDDLNKPLTIHYQFRIPSYAVSLEDEVYLNMALDKNDVPRKLEKKRTLPLHWRFAVVQKLKVSLDLGEEFELVSLPKNSNYNHVLFGHDIAFSEQGNTVVRETMQTINTIALNPSEFGEWNANITALQKAHSEQIVLKRK